MPINLFVLDDHKIVRDGIRALLIGNKEIIYFSEASNIQEFRDSFKAQDISVAILDIGLPDGSGIDICKELHDEHPGIKTIMLTANDDEKSIVQSVKAGAKGFLHKDASKEEFIEAVKTVANNDNYFSEKVLSIVYKGYIENIREELPPEAIQLTEREIEIVKLISDGLSYKEIAAKLFISPRTVETHRNNILSKLNLKNNIELVKFAIKNEYVSLQ